MALRTERERVAHLLRRFGLATSVQELDHYSAMGYSGALEALIDPPHEEGFDLEPQRFANPDNGNTNVRGMQAHWYVRLLATRHPLREALTIFWHNHFATSATKVVSPVPMHRHIEVLRKNALRPFPIVLTQALRDPAMIFWLDNQLNVAGKPNENLAREVLELFTLGEGNYTESDVKEAARALTGWTFAMPNGRVPGNLNARATFRQLPRLHDPGMKTILGETKAFDGGSLISLLVARRETATYVVRKFWEWFVYSNPSTGLIDNLADEWRKSGLSTEWLVRAVANHPEFLSERAERGLVKNPVQFAHGVLRQLGTGDVVYRRATASDEPEGVRIATMAIVAGNSSRAMGMDLLFPPDVAGWSIGDAWINTATMLKRIEYADEIFENRQRALAHPMVQRLGGDATPTRVVEALLTVLDAPEDPPVRELMIQAAQKQLERNGSAQNRFRLVHVAARTLFASPSFQFV